MEATKAEATSLGVHGSAGYTRPVCTGPWRFGPLLLGGAARQDAVPVSAGVSNSSGSTGWIGPTDWLPMLDPAHEAGPAWAPHATHAAWTGACCMQLAGPV